MGNGELVAASIGWNPGEKQRILIAGDLADLARIRLILATLPPKATGQVFIATDFEDEIETVEAPHRFSVCWLIRSRGQELRRSVDAWLSEMLPVSGEETHGVYSWIAADGEARLLVSD